MQSELVNDHRTIPTSHVIAPRPQAAGFSARRVEVIVDEATRDSDCCERCAATTGTYSCEQSTAVEPVWLSTREGRDILVSLQRPDSRGARVVRVAILVESARRVHARAVYYSRPLTTNELDAPLVAMQVKAESDCGHSFPPMLQLRFIGIQACSHQCAGDQ